MLPRANEPAWLNPRRGARRRAFLSLYKAELRDAPESIAQSGRAVLGEAEELRQWIEKVTSRIGASVRYPVT